MMQSFVLAALHHGRNIPLGLDMTSFGHGSEAKITDAVLSMANKTQSGRSKGQAESRPAAELLPRRIHFPYSRHSSYPELCDLVAAFRPKDVWPCTVDAAEWRKDSK